MVKRQTAEIGLLLPLALVAGMGACHRLVPAMPIDMALVIIAGIVTAIVIMLQFDRG